MKPLPINATLSNSAIFVVRENDKEYTLTLAQLKAILNEGSGSEYTAGTGISIEENEIAIDLSAVTLNNNVNIAVDNSNVDITASNGNVTLGTTNGNISIDAGEGGETVMDGGAVRINSTNGTDTSNIEFTATGTIMTSGSTTITSINEMRITSPVTVIEGADASYFADYSASYTNRSLVDKEYVDNAIAAAIAAI